MFVWLLKLDFPNYDLLVSVSNDLLMIYVMLSELCTILLEQERWWFLSGIGIPWKKVNVRSQIYDPLYMLWFNFILGSNFIFLWFKLITIHYNTQKQKKVKFEPRTKSNHDIGATTKPNRNKQFCPWIEECSSHLKINEKKISSVAQHGKLHYPWKKIYTKKENGGIKKIIWSQNI